LLAVAVDEDIELRSIQTGQLLRPPLQEHDHDIDCVVVHDGTIISGSKDETIRLWDGKGGVPVGPPLCSHTGMIHCLAADENSIVSAGTEGIELWDRKTGESRPLTLQPGFVSAVAINPKLIASAGWDQAIQLRDRKNLALVGEPLLGHKSGIYGLEFVGDMIVSGSWDHTIRRWDINTCKPLNGPIPGDEIGAAAQAHNTDRILGQDATNPLWMDGYRAGRLDWMLSLWDVRRPDRFVQVAGAAIPHRDGGIAEVARLYDPFTGECMAEIRLGFVVNAGIFRDPSLYLACRLGLLRIDFLA
jgi:WD40 repeat protein